jgi:hypothetical protein
MNTTIHDEMIKDVEELRLVVSKCDSVTILGSCATYLLKFEDNKKRSSPLNSPVRQIFFLLGLMLTTDEPILPEMFSKEMWDRSRDLLNNITNAYAILILPNPEEEKYYSERWKEISAVSSSAFLHFHNTGLLATVEQVVDRISNDIATFDDSIETDLGINSTTTIKIIDWISNYLQESLDKLLGLRENLGKGNNEQVHKEFSEQMDSFLQIKKELLEQEFGKEIIDVFWDLFVSKRGMTSEFIYYTERNVAEDKPLFQVDEETLYCPTINSVYWAVLNFFEEYLIDSPNKHSFTRRRDKNLEEKVLSNIRKVLDSTAEYYTGLFESETLHNEHDLIVRDGKTVLVIESKASPPIEPFRDPEKAYTRIRRHFQSDKGIQKAFEQASHIQRKLFSGESVFLYNNNRKLITEFKPDEIEKVYCICLTRDDYGPLATDLSLLLEKEESDPYPWATNIYDLDTMVNAWNYFGWGSERFYEFLDERSVLHGKVFTTDELEFTGYFIKHGNYAELIEADGDLLMLDNSYSDVFDRIYQAEKGGEAVEFNPTGPTMADTKDLFRKAQLIEGPKLSPHKETKQGRNEKCACGSGKKYKRCCGR